MKKIIILDFENGFTYITDYDEGRYNEIEEFLEYFNSEQGINLRSSSINYMVVDTLHIEIL